MRMVDQGDSNRVGADEIYRLPAGPQRYPDTNNYEVLKIGRDA